MANENFVYYHVIEESVRSHNWIVTSKKAPFKLFKHLIKSRIKGFFKPFDVSKGHESLVCLSTLLHTKIFNQLKKLKHQKTHIGYDHYKF